MRSIKTIQFFNKISENLRSIHSLKKFKFFLLCDIPVNNLNSKKTSSKVRKCQLVLLNIFVASINGTIMNESNSETTKQSQTLVVDPNYIPWDGGEGTLPRSWSYEERWKEEFKMKFRCDFC